MYSRRYARSFISMSSGASTIDAMTALSAIETSVRLSGSPSSAIVIDTGMAIVYTSAKRASSCGLRFSLQFHPMPWATRYARFNATGSTVEKHAMPKAAANSGTPQLPSAGFSISAACS